MDAVAAIAKVKAAPGKRRELATALQFALDNVEGEPGTRLYLLHEDNQDDDALWFYELYENDAALKAHMGSEWFAKLGPIIGPLLGGPPELTFVTPIGGKGL